MFESLQDNLRKLAQNSTYRKEDFLFVNILFVFLRALKKGSVKGVIYLYTISYNVNLILLIGKCNSIGRVTVCGTVGSRFKS